MKKMVYRATSACLLLLLVACGGGADPAAQPMLQADVAPRARALAAKDSSTEVILTPTLATASASERGDLSAAAAIDHDANTRWSSGFDDNQYLTLDFGKSVAITRVHIDWENAHATQYLLQVSDDGARWATIKSVSDSQGGTEDWSGLSGQGRYLRMQGLKRSTPYGYSIFEIQAFSGTPPSPTSPTPAPQPTPVDSNQPGVQIKPVTATSSALENPGNPALLAIDGKPGTRWASAFEDGAWIQFDFGAKAQIGYLKLVWENAYGKAYQLLSSDDGQHWNLLRDVSKGQGGSEEFFNLGANARYLRLQGVARASQYGYSLYEVEFKSPGSDNTQTDLATSALKFPADGSALAPLPSSAEPLETLQFSLPDGTLVTRFGVRGLARHARERGEAWNEIGYGPNDTVDPLTGLPVDKGPGNYLTFVPQYFKNRSWGFEIIDNSRVAGVTKPTLAINQYTQVDFTGPGVVFFRGYDRPGVTDYGWMTGADMVDPKATVCRSAPYPGPGKLASANGINGGCTVLVKDYPQHGELGADGLPNGKTVPARPLVAGDVVEVAPSFFTTPQALLAKGDTGGIRYYANEWVYVVGSGLKPWYGV